MASLIFACTNGMKWNGKCTSSHTNIHSFIFHSIPYVCFPPCSNSVYFKKFVCLTRCVGVCDTFTHTACLLPSISSIHSDGDKMWEMRRFYCCPYFAWCLCRLRRFVCSPGEGVPAHHPSISQPSRDHPIPPIKVNNILFCLCLRWRGMEEFVE